MIVFIVSTRNQRILLILIIQESKEDIVDIRGLTREPCEVINSFCIETSRGPIGFLRFS